MLADLERIRDLQVLQRRALVDADGARIDELDQERAALTDRLQPISQMNLDPDEAARARELVDSIVAEQQALVKVAETIKAEVGARIGQTSEGRGAVSAYRVRGGEESRYLDRSQ